MRSLKRRCSLSDVLRLDRKAVLILQDIDIWGVFAEAGSGSGRGFPALGRSVDGPAGKSWS